MKNAIAVGVVVFLSIVGSASMAKSLDFDSAIKVLVGKT